MIFQKILKSTIKEPEGSNGGCMLIVIGLMLAAAIILKVVSFTSTETSIPLLTNSEGVQQLEHTQDIEKYTNTTPLIPTELVGGELFVIGVYTLDSDTFPKDSIALVYTKNNSRFFEIDQLSKGSLEEERNKVSKENFQEILLNKSTPGLLINLRDGFDCTNQRGGSQPTMCQLTNLLIFEHNDLLIKIYVDGDKLTEGELLKIGKSLIK